MKLSQVIEELVEEKGLDRTLLGSIICDGLLAAYNKRFPHLVFQVSYNRKTDEIETRVQKKVVTTVEDDDAEISLRKARAINPEAELGTDLVVPFDGKIGRIEILRAKQVIATKIRGVEAAAVFNEYKDRKDTIVHGTIHKCERNGMSLKLDDSLAFLPNSLSLPTDKCIVGYSIRALLKDVLEEPRNDYQLILDRASADFVRRLFELEIPEIFEKIVEIKKIVRIPGYKTKVAVISHDKNIDPVGTCVGVGGVRIKPILKELGGEKIDVIPWRESVDDMIADALKPAVISRVEVVDGSNAQVWLDEDQRSLAIGKMGQNIALASQLVGLNLNLVQGERTRDHGIDLGHESNGTIE
ncbi:MAG TPA: transcription termination factor NusA [Candidatus Babeliales bacterium]|nr:transcription termination factor NusA [Candidatus Babeliales bacterium]